MKVYLSFIDDRHSDTDATVFFSKEKAIEHAKQQAKEFAERNGEEVEEDSIPGWLYYAVYSSEGDSVWVREKDIQGEPV